MNHLIFDIEAPGLLYPDKNKPVADKIYCLCYSRFTNGVQQDGQTTDYAEMKAIIEDEDYYVVGHKIKQYDLPMLEKFTGAKRKSKIIDTLGLSWYLYPNRLKHGLEEWGEDLGIAKPKIADWQNLSIEEYLHRCSMDVKINTALFHKQILYLQRIYDYDTNAINRIMGYLTYKLDCAAEQEAVTWRLDVEKAKANLAVLMEIKQEKEEILSKIMPPVITHKIKSRPKKPFKQDGSLSKIGEDWFELLKEMELPDYHMGAIKIPDKVLRGNPGSFDQIKNWLFSLSWKPTTFKVVKDKTDPYGVPPRKVPQLSSDDGSGICESVKKLYEAKPELIELEDLFIVRHRIGILTAFLEEAVDGVVRAQIGGFTNTLRFKHKNPLVNLPTIPKKYWEMIRGVLISPSPDHILCGSDMSGLEDNTKQHYMYFYDPNYVKEMRTPGFNAHIDMSIQAKKMSYDEGEFYKWYDNRKEGKDYKYIEPAPTVNRLVNFAYDKALTYEALLALPEEDKGKLFKILKPIRLKCKKVNFAAVYGAGPPKLAETMSSPLSEARELHTIYWKRNKAVKIVAEKTRHKIVDGQMWLSNPVSKFWYSLRYEKDKFSTLNQGTGVYCFDTWTNKVRRQGWKLCGQFHDEIIAPILRTQKEALSKDLKRAIDEVNAELKLNVLLAISIDYGDSYADIH